MIAFGGNDLSLLHRLLGFLGIFVKSNHGCAPFGYSPPSAEEKTGDSPLRGSPKALKSALVAVRAGAVLIFSQPARVRLQSGCDQGRDPDSEHSYGGPDALTTLDRTLAGTALLDHRQRQAAP